MICNKCKKHFKCTNKNAERYNQCDINSHLGRCICPKCWVTTMKQHIKENLSWETNSLHKKNHYTFEIEGFIGCYTKEKLLIIKKIIEEATIEEI